MKERDRSGSPGRPWKDQQQAASHLLLQEMLTGHHRRRRHRMTASDPHPGSRHTDRRHVRHRALHIIVVIRWWGRLLVQDAEFILFSLEILIAIIADLTVWACLMRATMSGLRVSLVRGFGALQLRQGHTELGYRSERKLCCSGGRRMVVLAYGF